MRSAAGLLEIVVFVFYWIYGETCSGPYSVGKFPGSSFTEFYTDPDSNTDECCTACTNDLSCVAWNHKKTLGWCRIFIGDPGIPDPSYPNFYYGLNAICTEVRNSMNPGDATDKDCWFVGRYHICKYDLKTTTVCETFEQVQGKRVADAALLAMIATDSVEECGKFCIGSGCVAFSIKTGECRLSSSPISDPVAFLDDAEAVSFGKMSPA